MDSPGVLVRRAREAAALKPEQLAAWARLDLGRLEELEAGKARFTWRELDRCACVFGSRVDDLLDGEAGRAPMTLLLRSDQDENWRSTAYPNLRSPHGTMSALFHMVSVKP